VPLVVWLAAYVLSAITGPEVATAVFVVAALCRLYGDYAYRSCVVQAGAYEPLVPATPSASRPMFMSRSGAVGASTPSARH
jgi:hypothetical protein